MKEIPKYREQLNQIKSRANQFKNKNETTLFKKYKEANRINCQEEEELGKSQLLMDLNRDVDEQREKKILIKQRTLEVVNFFVEDLGFDQRDILYFTEDEIRQLVKLLDQSQIFKKFPKHFQSVIEKLSKRVFIGNENKDEKQPPSSNC